MHVAHPVLVPEAISFRGYQANLARIAAKRDTLVVLPTGMGKTVIALLALADALRDGAKRILILAPTRPLVEQHGRYFTSVLAGPWSANVHVLTGNTPPTKRQAAYQQEGLLIATPQVIQNDLVAARFDLSNFDWIVYDEAHRAAGDYPYTAIGKRAIEAGIRRMGLTASPGHDVKKIDDVRRHLGFDHVEIRTPVDPDVVEYVQPMRTEWETLPLPESLSRVSKRLHEALAGRVRALRDLGFLKGAPSKPRRYDLLDLQRKLQSALQKPDPDASLYAALSLQAQAMKILHAIEQAETQGASAFVQYMETVRGEAAGSKPSKASRAVAEDPLLNEAYHIARMDATENPKLGRTQALVQEQLAKDPNARIICFTHYRGTCEQVAESLATLPGVRPVVFVGQSKRGASGGMTQKQQADAVARFTAGEHNVLVATSVAEEGLDIPETDLVVFYEPIPSEIRSIQRRGRTGRNREGRCVVLMTKGTQDEAAHWTARRKEQQMIQELQALRAHLVGKAPAAAGQTTLDAPRKPPTPSAKSAEAKPEGPRIICDHREQAGGVVRHLSDQGARIEMRQLEVGDFVLSDRVVVERKSTKDFVDSLVDGRLFDQLRTLRAYPRPMLILEGASLHGHRHVAPEALWAAVASIVTDYQLPVLRTEGPSDTARLMLATAKREQTREGRRVAIRSASKAMNDHEQSMYLLCGLPGVNTTLASRLLSHFGSAANVFAADETALAGVEGIGPSKAADILRVLHLPPKAGQSA